MASTRIPAATYRLQVNRAFRFEDARTIVPYLHRLGITDIYSSPILKARTSSPHGYDVTDPTCLNPELGTIEDFNALALEMRAHDMGLVLDIVPNHMAASSENSWWMDILENGARSQYTSLFDIDWHQPQHGGAGRVLLPILGRPYAEVLQNREIVLALEEDGFTIRYYEHRLPVNIQSWGLILLHRFGNLEAGLGKESPGVQCLSRLAAAAQKPAAGAGRTAATTEKMYAHQANLKRELAHLLKGDTDIKAFVAQSVQSINGISESPASPDLLDQLISRQAYRLAFWKTGVEEINYRRFFDISDLVGVRVELPDVLRTTHKLVFQLVQQGEVTGLRIDHIDGLRDPLQYLRRLQHQFVGDDKAQGRSPRFYIIVEKILTGGETLPGNWPVSGTTGYDFANLVNALFVWREGSRALADLYARLTWTQAGFQDIVYEKKVQVLTTLFAGEARRLGHELAGLGAEMLHPACSEEDATRALIGTTACLPVYRTYTRTARVSARDRQLVEALVDEARRRDRRVDAEALALLKRVLLLDTPPTLSLGLRRRWLDFVMRWQQLTGPAMAKGLEDTALYTYNRLISLNEVGGDAGSHGVSLDEFHSRMLLRLKEWPDTMNATSTHDTKRGEDVRARINVLSEIPDAWEDCLARWEGWNECRKRTVCGHPVPDTNTELLLYQTLLGAWPQAEDGPAFMDRLKAYAIKAAREAKVHTSWLSPAPEYEDALVAFLASILQRSPGNEFLQDFLRLQRRVAFHGIINSLAQVLLKITCPGIPDFYQGSDLLDLSLVDPDNRRPVDFARRVSLLDDLEARSDVGQEALVDDMLRYWEDGRLKLYVMWKALNMRRHRRDLYRTGRYVALRARGEKSDHVCAFARRQGTTWSLTAVPRFTTRLVSPEEWPLGKEVWGNDLLLLPRNAPRHWHHVLTGETVERVPSRRALPVSLIFRRFPAALLVAEG